MNSNRVLAERYRPAERLRQLEISDRLSTKPGFFRIGGAVCFGRTANGCLQPTPTADLYDELPRVGGGVVLPFDPNEVIDNLRFERYGMSGAQQALATMLAKRAYYTMRRVMPVRFRRELQKLYFRGWRRISFPAWPIDRTVESLFEQLLSLSMGAEGAKTPFIWFWPEGYTGCVTMTHDVETKAGLHFCERLIEIDRSFGITASFQFVPEERYAIPAGFLNSLRAHGCEINIHGLNHGPDLFRDRREFQRQARLINAYALEFGATGFRSPCLYRNADWFDALHFSYDMSMPNSAHLEAQRGGCCTVMPYFIGDMVELPLTMTQDYSLFHILGDYSIDLWKQEVELVIGSYGLASFNTHPDYLMSGRCLAVYKQLLSYLRTFCKENRVWLARPGEVDRWWRDRQKMQLQKTDKGYTISGAGSDRAIVAYASRRNGRIVYEFARSVRALRAA